MTEPVTVKVTETPVERLRKLSLAPDVTREDLWEAIAEAVTNIDERLAVLEASATQRARSSWAFDPRRTPLLDPTRTVKLDAGPVQPG